MPHVVTGDCQGCRCCVSVCPQDCFYADDKMLYINPDDCIDCGSCVSECPVEAIYEESDLPEDMEKWAKINAEKCSSGDLENVTG